jgi:hypothetical protein
MAMATRVIVVGILRGSRRGMDFHNQAYRKKIRTLIENHIPGGEVYSPIESAKDMHDYGLVRGIEAFFDMVRRASQYDALVVYVPEASMGSAIMMWEAYRNQRMVVTISPLLENRTIRALSTVQCKDLREFTKFVKSGQFASLLAKSTADREKM